MEQNIEFGHHLENLYVFYITSYKNVEIVFMNIIMDAAIYLPLAYESPSMYLLDIWINIYISAAINIKFGIWMAIYLSATFHEIEGFFIRPYLAP